MKPTQINVNGYDTYCIDRIDDERPHLVIAIPPNAGKDISKLCGSIICKVDYQMVDGTRFILAYY